jgi:hypothetical protein
VIKRQLVYQWVSLPRVRQINIAEQLVGLTEAEMNLPDRDHNVLILKRIESQGKLEQFKQMVTAAHVELRS